MKKHILLFSFILVGAMTAHAAIFDSISAKARLGYQIGASSPLSIPATITSIDAFRLTPSLMAGADVSVTLSDSWTLSTGLRIENKAMDVEVSAKGYHMEVKKGSDKLDGLFFGHVSQQSTQWMFTLPIYASYNLGTQVKLKAGPYISYLLKKAFDGTASDGYIRQGGATGAKINICDTPSTWATYDFSDEMRSMQWGVSIGVDWQALPHLGFSADINMGLSGIFPTDFKTVEQTLYPIYGTLGIFYIIK